MTTTAPDFFERLGFARIDRARIPAPIAATAAFAALCPAWAICMALTLAPRLAAAVSSAR